MKKKILIISSACLGVVLTVLAFIFLFTGTDKKSTPVDDNLYINYSTNLTDNSLQLMFKTNKKVDLTLSVKIENCEEETTKITTSVIEEANKQYGYIKELERKETLYLVEYVKLYSGETEVFARTDISVIALVPDNPIQPDVEPVEIKGEVVSETNDKLTIKFIENHEIIIPEEVKMYLNDETTNEYQIEGQFLVLNKSALNIGDYALKVVSQNGINSGIFYHDFSISENLFVSNVALIVNDEYYKTTPNVQLTISMDNLIGDVKTFTINGKDYEAPRYKISETTSKRLYTVNVDVETTEEDDSVSIELTKISHERGDISFDNLSTVVNLKNVSFDAALECDKNAYFEGDSQNISITLNNPALLYILSYTCNGTEYEVLSSEEEYLTNLNSEVKEKNVLNSIKYKLYGVEREYLLNKEITSNIYEKVSTWSYNEYVKSGDDFELIITLDKDITGYGISFSGDVDFNTSNPFDETNTTYVINQNEIKINLSDYLTGVNKYHVYLDGLTLKLNDASYTICVDESTDIYYSNEIFGVTNMVKETYEDGYRLKFNAITFDDNLKINNVGIILYDADGNVLVNENTPNNVFENETSNEKYYYIIYIPSETVSYKLVYINYEIDGVRKQLSDFYLKDEIRTITTSENEEETQDNENQSSSTGTSTSEGTSTGTSTSEGTSTGTSNSEGTNESHSWSETTSNGTNNN